MKTIISLLGHWFYTGKAPKAPGTFGTLGAIPFAYVIHIYLGIYALLAATLFISVLGVWVCNRYMAIHGLEHDPSEIVIDEVSGYWLTISAMPLWYVVPDFEPVWRVYLWAFIAFRFFDIVKPWPIGWADKRVKGGLGVMLDDWLAAIMAILVIGAISHAV